MSTTSIPDSDTRVDAARLPGATVALFLWCAPIAVAVAGLLLLVRGELLLQTHWSPETIAFAHLGTLGFVSMTAIGSVYMIVPTLTGRPLASPRLPLFVFASLGVGILAFVVGLLLPTTLGVSIAIATLFPGVACFVVPMGLALRRRHVGGDGATLRLALTALTLAAALGIWVAHGHGGMRFPGNRALWLEVHLSIALFGWVGGFSLQIFELMTQEKGAEPPALARRTIRGLLWLGILAPVLLLALDYTGLAEGLALADDAGMQRLASIALLPAVVAIWVISPFVSTSRVLAHPDASIRRYWLTIFALGLSLAPLAVLARASGAPLAGLLFGWCAVWGWAGLIVQCVWQHWLPREPRAALEANDGMAGDVVPYALHLAGLLTGGLAIVFASDTAARVTGALLIAVSIVLLSRMRGIRRGLAALENP